MECNKKRLRNSRSSKVEEVVSYPDHPRQEIKNELPDKDEDQYVILLMELS